MEYNKKVNGYYYQAALPNAGSNSILLFDETRVNIAGIIYFEPEHKPVLSPNLFENGCPVLHFRQSKLPTIVDLLESKSDVFIRVSIKETEVKSAQISAEGTEPIIYYQF